jgi:hypothetical protein
MLNTTIYPSHYTEADIAIYDSLIAQGSTVIGKKISKEEEYLLHLSACITINKHKGISNNLTPEEIENIRKINKNVMAQQVHNTPEDLVQGDYIVPTNGDPPYLHPFSPLRNITPPGPDLTSNIEIHDNSTDSI